MTDGDVIDMRVDDEGHVERIRSAIVELQKRRDPISGAKAMLEQQQANVAQLTQAAIAIMERPGGEEQATLQLQDADGGAFQVFEQMMDRFPAAPEGVEYVVATTGRRGWLTPEGAMQVRTVEEVELPDDA